MSDIVERLRRTLLDDAYCEPLHSEAADKIESLRSRLAEVSRDRDGYYHEAATAHDRLAEAEALLRDVAAVVYESTGVYGFHMNGDLERWDYWPVFARIDAHLGRDAP